MTDVSLLTGAAIFLAGMLTNRFLPIGRRRRKLKPVKPICDCSHSISYHADGGACHASTRHYKGAFSDGSEYEHVACGCQKYTGPEPLPEYYAPELSTPR